MALFEPFDRQPEQPSCDIGCQGKAHARTSGHQHEGSQQAGNHVDQREQPETDRQHGEQVTVERRQGAVEGDLHVVRHRQNEDLQHHAQEQHLRKRALEAGHALPQLRHLQPFAQGLPVEIVAGAQFQGNPGEVVRHLGQRHPVGATVGVMDQRLAAFHRLDHHVVIEIPVEDRRHVEVAQLFKRQLHRARGQPDIVSEVDQGAQRSAAH